MAKSADFENKSRALWKRGICTDFIVIFQVARNPLKLGTPNFCVKNVCFVFQAGRKVWTKLCEKSTPLPLSLPISKLYRISILENWNTVCVCLRHSHHWREGEGEGGGLSWMCLKPCFPACGKKCGDVFQIRVGIPNFSGFRATWKIATKSVHTPTFHGALHYYLIPLISQLPIWAFQEILTMIEVPSRDILTENKYIIPSCLPGGPFPLLPGWRMTANLWSSSSALEHGTCSHSTCPQFHGSDADSSAGRQSGSTLQSAWARSLQGKQRLSE